MSAVRVVSWNVRSLRDGAGAVAAALADLHPDIVLLQEAPRLLLWRWSGWLLSRRSGLRRVVGGAPAAGNLLLVSERVTVVESHAVRLPKHRGLHRRGAVQAVLEVDGTRLAVLGTHLDLDAAARVETAHALRTALVHWLHTVGAGAAEGPGESPPVVAGAGPALVIGADVNEEPGQPALVIGADVNEEPGQPAWAALSAGLVDVATSCGPTFPQRAPRRRIDALFVDPAWTVLAVHRPDPGPVSDHLPLVADLAWTT